MASLKDIAKECGVSIATVSKALNGQSDVSEKKREEIKEAAVRLGYTPNYSARALKTHRSFNLGVLFMDEANSGLTHDYFSAIIESFKVNAERKGYDITFLNTSSSTRSYYDHCRYRGLDGVIIACIDFYKRETQELIRSSIPIVTIDHIFDGKTAILSDNVKGMADLTEYICSRGHRKIAFIHGKNSSTTQSRLTGFFRTLAKYGIDIPEAYLREAAYRDIAETARQTQELLLLPDRPTCIIFPDDFAALGGMNTIRNAGLRIPEDISVAGYDGLVLSRALEPALTSLRQDTYEIGRCAAEQLISLIEQPRLTLIEKHVVPGYLQPGMTVKKLSD